MRSLSRGPGALSQSPSISSWIFYETSSCSEREKVTVLPVEQLLKIGDKGLSLLVNPASNHIHTTLLCLCQRRAQRYLRSQYRARSDSPGLRFGISVLRHGFQRAFAAMILIS